MRVASSIFILVMLVVSGCAITAPRAVPDPYAHWVNPLPRSPEVIELGQKVYRQHCAGCHGIQADGLGPAAAALDVQPVDLRYGYSDAGQLYRGITLGVEGSPMPGFDRKLSLTDRAATIHYLQTFPGNRPTYAAR